MFSWMYIFLICMGLETAYEHYLDHKMPLAQNTIIKK